MTTLQAIGVEFTATKDWLIGLTNFPKNEKLLELRGTPKLNSDKETSVPFIVPADTRLQMRGIELVNAFGTVHTLVTFLVLDSTKLVPDTRLDIFSGVHLQVFAEDLRSLSSKADDMPDLWVSMQHDTPVAIPGYGVPDQTVYKNWRKARYVD